MIDFYEIHLSDREANNVFRLRPAVTSEFGPVYMKAKAWVGEKVKLSTRIKYVDNNPITTLVDIALDKRK